MCQWSYTWTITNRGHWSSQITCNNLPVHTCMRSASCSHGRCKKPNTYLAHFDVFLRLYCTNMKFDCIEHFYLIWNSVRSPNLIGIRQCGGSSRLWIYVTFSATFIMSLCQLLQKDEDQLLLSFPPTKRESDDRLHKKHLTQNRWKKCVFAIWMQM